MPTSPMRQTHFQWFADDGPPATSSALRREDSNLPAVAAGAHMLVRSQSQHIGRHNLAAARQLQYRKVGSNAWRPVGALAVPPYDMPLVYPSTWFADGDPITTQRLSTPIASATENFIGGQARQSELDTDPANYGPRISPRTCGPSGFIRRPRPALIWSSASLARASRSSSTSRIPA